MLLLLLLLLLPPAAEAVKLQHCPHFKHDLSG
jgi:hypothetical protein